MPQRIIGLTGGIATGKSTVAEILRYRHIPVLDADQFARAAVEPGSPVLEQIESHFGSGILNQSGDLDRRALGRRVFEQPQERLWLESQIHPYVKHQFRLGLQEHQKHCVICFMIPLLFEAHMTDWVTEIWVVICGLDQQYRRIAVRDSLSRDEIEARIRSQWPLSQKVAQATHVLDNSGSLAELEDQVDQALLNEPVSQPSMWL